jgi:hypothetical protein
MNTNSKKTIDDTYFRRFFVPLVISFLVIAGVFVVVTATPGTPVAWNTSPSVFGNIVNNMNGGMRRLLTGHR